MAISTISYRQIASIPIGPRIQMAASLGDSFANELTPGQRVSLFPSYYKDFVSSGGGAFGGPGGSTLSGSTGSTGTTPAATQPISGGNVPVKPANVSSIPEDKKAMMSSVYKSFLAAGFSKQQAMALTAEVGRENDFASKYIFGSHIDPANGATNIGFLSWQKERGTAVYEKLKSMGLVDPKTGAISRSQEALNVMAKFTYEEMKNNPAYKETAKKFLGNPNIDAESAALVLGRNYSRWRIDDPAYATHISRRRSYYEQVLGIVNEEEKNATVTRTRGLTRDRTFIGDSIAEGLKNQVGGSGNTLQSRSPAAVLKVLQDLGADAFKGKTVILSTGLTNNVTDLASVRAQLDFLKSAGATVQIVGMAQNNPKFAPGNEQLSALATEYGFQFLGGFDYNPNDSLQAHPNYAEYSNTHLQPVTDQTVAEAKDRIPDSMLDTPIKMANGETKTYSELGITTWSQLDATGIQAYVGGHNDPNVAYTAALFQDILGANFNRKTAQNDAYHTGTGSRHTLGTKFDFTVKDMNPNDAIAILRQKLLDQYGLEQGKDYQILNEYDNPSALSTGGHLDVEIFDPGRAKIDSLRTQQAETYIAQQQANAPEEVATAELAQPLAQNTQVTLNQEKILEVAREKLGMLGGVMSDEALMKEVQKRLDEMLPQYNATTSEGTYTIPTAKIPEIEKALQQQLPGVTFDQVTTPVPTQEASTPAPPAPVAYKYNEKGIPIDPNTGYPMDAKDPRYASALAAAPKPTATVGAAHGAEVTKPYLAKPVDGDGPNIYFGEHPETIIPTNRLADSVGQQPYQSPLAMAGMFPDMPARPDNQEPPNVAIAASNGGVTSYPSMQSQTSIMVDHPVMAPSLRKYMADSKLESRWNELSPIGGVYTNYGSYSIA